MYACRRRLRGLSLHLGSGEVRQVALHTLLEIASEIGSEIGAVSSVARPRAITAPHRGTTARLGRFVGARYGARCSCTLVKDARERAGSLREHRQGIGTQHR